MNAITVTYQVGEGGVQITKAMLVYEQDGKYFVRFPEEMNQVVDLDPARILHNPELMPPHQYKGVITLIAPHPFPSSYLDH